MERLEPKKINGHIYYYYSEWGWVNGKCRRIWQKYLGKPKDIYKAVAEGGPAPKYAEVFQWGLPTALWRETLAAKVIEETDKLCPKRDQGLSTGEYLAIAAINRAIHPSSKRSMWDWFSQTVLLRTMPQASKAALSSQRFWDHMDRIQNSMAYTIWKAVIKGVIKREAIDLSSICYDGTNFYTFIDTFNTKCKMAKRGKNKQGRNNLRQISYALFLSAHGHIPLFYEVYEGNRHDAKQFPLILKKFHDFLGELSGGDLALVETTLIFDKGNNSEDNFALLDSLQLRGGEVLKFVGSVKLDEHKYLAEISNDDPSFVPCRSPELEGTKAFRVKKEVYGRERVLVVTYNQNLYNAQWLTIQNEISKAMEKLGVVKQRLEDRANGIVKRGKKPMVQSVKGQVKKILSRQHMKRVIKTEVTKGADGIPRLEYSIDSDALAKLSKTYLGKNIIVTNREEWDDEVIVKSYRSQFIIEDVFKEMKDRVTGSWWPLLHWTDSKIRVHGLYCTIALLLRALMLRRVKMAGLNISMKRLLTKLDAIREVVNIYPAKGRNKVERKQTVLSKTSDVQQQLISILGLKKEKNVVLG